MAKRVGSETQEAGLAPGQGHNSDGIVTPELFLQAVRDVGAEKAKVKAANAAYKQVRKRFGGLGVKLTVLDAAMTMAEWTRDEIRDHFDIQAKYAEWLGMPVAPGILKQGDSLKDLTDEAMLKREWFAVGRTYSRLCKPGKPPEECPPEFYAAFMAGFNEEDEAAWNDADKPDEPEEVQAAAPKPAKADKKAKATESPLPMARPDWSKWDDNPEEWFAKDRRAFESWFESLGEDEVPTFEHVGAQAYFDHLVANEKAQQEAAMPPGAPATAEAGEALQEADPQVKH